MWLGLIVFHFVLPSGVVAVLTELCVLGSAAPR